MTPQELAAAIRAHPFSELAPELMGHVVQIMLSEAQPVTPTDTGFLQSSEFMRIEQGGMVVFVGTDTPYAVFQKVEFFQIAAESSVGQVEAQFEQIGIAWLDVIAKGA